MDCIFCKIVTKEIPTKILYEDDDTLSFLDAFPVAALTACSNHFLFIAVIKISEYILLNASAYASSIIADIT